MNIKKLIEKLKPVPAKQLCSLANIKQGLENIRQGIGYYDSFQTLKVDKLNDSSNIGILGDKCLNYLKKYPQKFLRLCKKVCNEKIPVLERFQKAEENIILQIPSDHVLEIISCILCIYKPNKYIPVSDSFVNYLKNEGVINEECVFGYNDYESTCLELVDVVKAIGLKDLAELHYTITYVESIKSVEYKKAIELFLNRQTDKAHHILDKILWVCPDFAPAYRLLARIYMVKGELQVAKDYCEKAINADENDYKSYVLKGNIYYYESVGLSHILMDENKEITWFGSSKRKGVNIYFLDLLKAKRCYKRAKYLNKRGFVPNYNEFKISEFLNKKNKSNKRFIDLIYELGKHYYSYIDAKEMNEINNLKSTEKDDLQSNPISTLLLSRENDSIEAYLLVSNLLHLENSIEDENINWTKQLRNKFIDKHINSFNIIHNGIKKFHKEISHKTEYRRAIEIMNKISSENSGDYLCDLDYTKRYIFSDGFFIRNGVYKSYPSSYQGTFDKLWEQLKKSTNWEIEEKIGYKIKGHILLSIKNNVSKREHFLCFSYASNRPWQIGYLHTLYRLKFKINDDRNELGFLTYNRDCVDSIKEYFSAGFKNVLRTGEKGTNLGTKNCDIIFEYLFFKTTRKIVEIFTNIIIDQIIYYLYPKMRYFLYREMRLNVQELDYWGDIWSRPEFRSFVLHPYLLANIRKRQLNDLFGLDLEIRPNDPGKIRLSTSKEESNKDKKKEIYKGYYDKYSNLIVDSNSSELKISKMISGIKASDISLCKLLKEILGETYYSYIPYVLKDNSEFVYDICMYPIYPTFVGSRSFIHPQKPIAILLFDGYEDKYEFLASGHTNWYMVKNCSSSFNCEHKNLCKYYDNYKYNDNYENLVYEIRYSEYLFNSINGWDALKNESIKNFMEDDQKRNNVF